MALRLPCLRRAIPPGMLTHSYWPGGVFYTPGVEVYLVCGQTVTRTRAGIDTQSDFIVCKYASAVRLGLSPPFGRQVSYSGAAGTLAGTLSFGPDGLVGLFVTDFTEYCYLPAPLVGFLPPPSGTAQQRSVLGMTGFLQHFRFVLDPDPGAPVFELHPRLGFPGLTGSLPRTGPLDDFIRSLHGP